MSDIYSEQPDTTEINVMSKEEKQWGMFCHLSALAILLIPSIGNIVGPLIIWLLKKDQYKFVDQEGKESINFQISITIYLYISAVLTLAIVGYFIAVGVFIFALVEIILASISASNGKSYTYPLTIRFIK